MRTDYIDLLQCHRFDANTPLDETIRTMDDLVRQGKILYWGVSRFNDEQIAGCRDLAAIMGTASPISNQFVYNLLERGIEASTLETCQSLGVGIIGYSPLAQGVLTGKYLDGQCPAGSRGSSPAVQERHVAAPAEQRSDRRATQRAVAARHGLELAALAIAWCLRLPGMTSVLTGASSPEQIRTNAQAAELELTPRTACRRGSGTAANPGTSRIRREQSYSRRHGEPME